GAERGGAGRRAGRPPQGGRQRHRRVVRRLRPGAAPPAGAGGGRCVVGAGRRGRGYGGASSAGSVGGGPEVGLLRSARASAAGRGRVCGTEGNEPGLRPGRAASWAFGAPRLASVYAPIRTLCHLEVMV